MSGGAPIHWFPGHMTRTLRRAKDKMALIDGVVQLLDARIPLASLNPELQEIYGEKPRLYVLTKSDLADAAVTKEWLRFFDSGNSACLAVNSKQKRAFAPVREAVEKGLEELLRHRRERGMGGAKIRLMVTGIPNVGKSTFINNWAGAVRARVADKPGVTRGEQWITAGNYELLDIPGVLWKRFDDAHTAVNLAMIGSIPDRLLNAEEMAAALLEQLAGRYTGRLVARYKLQPEEVGADGWQMLQAVGRRRGMLISGGEIDTERAAIMVLDEFRAGKLGRVSLQRPEERGQNTAPQQTDSRSKAP